MEPYVTLGLKRNLVVYQFSGQMKIVSFNVNGWASVNKKGFKEYVEKEDPDILCLQEIKIASEKVPDNFLKGYTQVFHSCKKPQHHGTAYVNSKL